MKTIAVCIFTYRGDADLLPMCVESVRHTLPDADVWILDDEHNPLSAEMQSKLSSQKRVLYKQTSFDRRGNLRGKDCIRGMLSAMNLCAYGSGAELVIKLDTDTLILGREWVDPLLANPWHGAWSMRKDGVPSGICYALKPEMLEVLSKAVDSLPLSDTVSEDLTILGLASMLSPNGYVLHEPQSANNLKGRWTAYNYSPLCNVTRAKYISQFEVISFGDHHVLGLPASSRIGPMSRILSAWKEKHGYLSAHF